jgi:hypothetical protein
MRWPDDYVLFMAALVIAFSVSLLVDGARSFAMLIPR